jgi:hypothetical protein
MLSSMNLLFTGRGNSGSWQIRGEQLGLALGARIAQGIAPADCKAADVVVVVKRLTDHTAAVLKKAGTPWVFDALDFYPQPRCSSWTREEAIDWVREHLQRYAPTGIIWPNARMREDCDIGIPGVVLKHHHRIGIERNPIRPAVKTVGYEGSSSYLGTWRPAIESECARRGWAFTVNPAHLADVDIVLAVRDTPFSGYAQRHWKSNVKLANAHGSGTPFVGQQECGYIETSTGGEYWTEDAGGLRVCFDWLTEQGARELIAERFVQKAYPVEQAAADLETFLHGL